MNFKVMWNDKTYKTFTKKWMAQMEIMNLRTLYKSVDFRMECE